MLTKSDKEFIRDTIKESLTVQVQLEKWNKETGIKETKVDTVYLPAFLVDYFSHLEGSLRGMQETVDHTKNRSVETKDGVAALGSIMLQFESGIKDMMHFVDYTKQKQIEDKIKERLLDEGSTR